MDKFLLDTNVIIDYCAEALKELEGDKYIVSTVLEELDKLKGDRHKGYKARRAVRALDEHRRQGNVHFVLPNESIISKATSHIKKSLGLNHYESDKNDNKIIEMARQLGCILVSNDTIVNLKCEDKSVGVKCISYRPRHLTQKGYIELECPLAEVNKEEVLNRLSIN